MNNSKDVKSRVGSSDSRGEEELLPEDDDLVDSATQTSQLTPDQIAASKATADAAKAAEEARKTIKEANEAAAKAEQARKDTEAATRELERKTAELRAQEAREEERRRQRLAEQPASAAAAPSQATTMNQATSHLRRGSDNGVPSQGDSDVTLSTNRSILHRYGQQPTGSFAQSESRLTASQADAHKYTASDKVRIKEIIERYDGCSVEFPPNDPARVRGPAQNLIQAIKKCEGIGTFSKGPFTLNFNITNLNDPASIEKVQAKINDLLKESIASGVPINNITINGKPEPGLVSTFPHEANKPISSIAIKSPTTGNEPRRPRLGSSGEG